MSFASVKNQYYATFCVNLLSLTYGAACGWPSAAFLLLQSEDTPLKSGPLSNDESSWVSSILCLGGIVGNCLFGWMADKFGRKLALLIIALPQIASCVILILARNTIHLCLSRFLSGVGGGAAFVLIPLYITEISEDRTRGSLGSLLVFSSNAGVLLAFLLANYLSYYVVIYTILALPILFLLIATSLPETPQYLLKLKKEKDAERALRYFRNERKNSKETGEVFKSELEKLKADYMDDSDKAESPLSLSDFTNKIAVKALVIGSVLIFLNQFCGCFAMLNYTATIFKKAGSHLSPNVSAVVVGAIQLLGSYFSTVLVERAGRKVLIAISAMGSGIGLTTFGMYTYLEGIGYDLSSFKWIPLASFSFMIFIASWGVVTLPFLVLSEILPPRIKSVGAVWCMNLLWIFAFVLIKFYPIVSEAFGMSACLFFFATCCFGGLIFVLMYVPETKGRSLEEIMAILNK